MGVRPLACWDCGFDHRRGMEVCLFWVLHVVGERCRRRAGHSFLCGFYFCFVVFSCIMSNSACNSLCNVLQTDADIISSSWGTIQELRLLKTISNAEKIITKDWYHVKSSAAALRWSVPLWRIVYCAHHTAQLNGISGSTLDMADIFFIWSRYLWNLEHLCQMMRLLKITM